jgi:antitoxin component of MazEF toxin-antitoxin module
LRGPALGHLHKAIAEILPLLDQLERELAGEDCRSVGIICANANPTEGLDPVELPGFEMIERQRYNVLRVGGESMIRQLRKIGDSNALILEQAILEMIGLEQEGEVQLTVDNGSLIITPANPKPVDRKQFEECLDRVVSDRRELLKRLAE